MSLDIYFKIPTDPAYSDSEVEVEDSLECFLQAVELILTTRRGEVIGHPTFGANLEDYLWNTRLSSSQIENAIRSQIDSYCSGFRVPYSVEVTFYREAVTDSMIVDILVDGTKVLGIGART